MARPIRFGLIGAGRWGKNYIKTLNALAGRCALTHLCTSHPENAALALKPPAVVPAWRDLVKSDCDAVIISSPSSTHAEILEACLDAKKPCIVEKPCFLDTATAERLCGRIEAEKQVVLVEYTQLFNPAYQALRKRLHETGETIRLIVSEGMSLGPFRGHEPALWDWCPHDLSLSLDLLDKIPESFSVLAGPRDLKGIPEQVSLHVLFPGNVSLWVQAGYLSQQKRRRLTVFTDERLYLFDDLASEKLTVAEFSYPKRYAQRAAGALKSEPIALRNETPPLSAAVVYFLEALRGGDRRYLDTRMTLQITRVLSGCERELAENKLSHVS